MQRFLRLAAVTGLMLGIAAPLCAQQSQMPPTAVSVQQIVAEQLPIINELPGRISSTRISEVRPRVSGILEERVFQQGSFVNEGDVLYRIDAAPFEVQVRAAAAALARAEATLSSAEVELRRQQQLRARNVTAGVELERAETVVLQGKADVAIAEAQLAEAQLNLDYTEVRAPISGVIGRALVTEGALVSSGGGEHLALIQQLDPIYVDFTQSASQMFALRRALEAGELIATAPGEATVQLYFDDGAAYEHRGTLLFSEAAVDATTGQVTLRAEFPNPDGLLLPGLYVRVRIEQAVNQHAIAIPQKAVLRDGRGNAQVYILGEGDEVSLRQVELGLPLEDRWLVRSGLEPGETLVVEGAQKLYPGAVVAPESIGAAPADTATDAAPVDASPADAAPAEAADDGTADVTPPSPDASASDAPTPDAPAPDAGN